MRVDLAPVVDCAAPRLFAERGVRLLAERLHVDLLLQEREPVRVELREVEEVADETGESVALECDDRERGLAGARILGKLLAPRASVADSRPGRALAGGRPAARQGVGTRPPLGAHN